MDPTAPTPTEGQSVNAEARLSRPTGITILAILAAIGGVLSVVGAVGLLAAGGVSGLVLILLLLTLAFGVLYLVLAYGLWTLRPWAWTLGVGLMVASILLTFVNVTQGLQYPIGAVISAGISAAVLFYLYTSSVKAAFGRS